MGLFIIYILNMNVKMIVNLRRKTQKTSRVTAVYGGTSINRRKLNFLDLSRFRFTRFGDGGGEKSDLKNFRDSYLLTFVVILPS